MADLARPDLLKQAKAERQERIKKLRSCECAWPITRYRNGDGHHPECPAHAQPNAARVRTSTDPGARVWPQLHDPHNAASDPVVDGEPSAQRGES